MTKEIKQKNKHGGYREGSGRPQEEPTKQLRIPLKLIPLVTQIKEFYKQTGNIPEIKETEK